MQRKLVVFLLCALACVHKAALAQQVVAFDNYGPNLTCDNAGGWMGSGLSSASFEAISFVPTTSGKITSITAGMYGRMSSTFVNRVTLYLLPQAGDLPPTRNALWSETFSNQLKINSPSSTFSPTNGPNVVAGTRYWLYAEVPLTGAFNPEYYWMFGLTGQNLYGSYSPSGVGTNRWDIVNPSTYPGYAARILVTVPEPSVAALGLIVLVQKRRVFRRI